MSEEFQQERNLPAQIREQEGKALQPEWLSGLTAEIQERTHQCISAETALLVLDMLLSHAQELLRYASPEFLLHEQPRILRLINVSAGMEHTPLPLYIVGADRMIPVVSYESEDELVHTDEHPYCGDPTCPCGGSPPTGETSDSDQEEEKEAQP